LEIGHEGILVVLGGGQVVDTESAREFMKEALGKISEEELHAIADEVEVKSRRFQQLLRPESIPRLEERQVLAILRSVFSTRRRAAEILRSVGFEPLKEMIRNLMHGPATPAERFQAFHDSLEGTEAHIRYDLPGELLHYGSPEAHWLWTRWIWDPKTETGALPLVIMEDHDLRGATAGETYMKVGEATLFVRATGDSAGFTRIGNGPFGIDVYLACVYAIYVYTSLRMRMTQEFNKVIPPLPELCRRLLGVHRMEV
jgi:hypothetical protein